MYLFILNLWVFFKIVNATEIFLFARDAWSERFALELPMDATLQNLHDEIMRQRQLNTTRCEVVLSFQGEQLEDLQASLADTGIGMQSTVDFNVVPFIPLELDSIQECDEEGDEVEFSPYWWDPRITFYWNPLKDLMQLDSMELDAMSFQVYEIDDVNEMQERTMQINLEDQIFMSHTFWIVPMQDIDEDILVIKDIEVFEPGLIQPLDLRRMKYAQDMVLKPSRNESLLLIVEGLEAVYGEAPEAGLQFLRYKVPEGHCLLLKHNNKKDAYHTVIDLAYLRGIAGVPGTDQSFDTAVSIQNGGFIKKRLNDAFFQVMLHDQHGKLKNDIIILHPDVADRTRHLFLIRPNEEIRQNPHIEQLKPGTHVNHLPDLDVAEYANDMALIAADGETLSLFVSGNGFWLATYVIPNGYGLWLQLKTECQRTVPLRFSGGPIAMDLTFDADRDFTQFAPVMNYASRMDFIGVWLCDYIINESGNWKKTVYFQSAGDRADSHLFRIVPTKQLDNETVSAFQHEYDRARIHPSHLRQEEYAKDLVVTPKHGQTLRLFWQRDNGAVSEYSLPAGYSVWLQYDEEARSVSLHRVGDSVYAPPQQPRIEYLNRDITLFEWSPYCNADYIGVWQCDQYGVPRSTIYYKARGDGPVDSHSFRIVSNRQIQQRFGNETMDVFRMQHGLEYAKLVLYPSDLRKAEYAKHLVFKAKPGQTLRLFYQQQQYLIPSAYSVLLHYTT